MVLTHTLCIPLPAAAAAATTTTSASATAAAAEPAAAEPTAKPTTIHVDRTHGAVRGWHDPWTNGCVCCAPACPLLAWDSPSRALVSALSAHFACIGFRFCFGSNVTDGLTNFFGRSLDYVSDNQWHFANGDGFSWGGCPSARYGDVYVSCPTTGDGNVTNSACPASSVARACSSFVRRLLVTPVRTLFFAALARSRRRLREHAAELPNGGRVFVATAPQPCTTAQSSAAAEPVTAAQSATAAKPTACWLTARCVYQRLQLLDSVVWWLHGCWYQ